MGASRRSILPMDDGREIRELLETYLSRAGFQVHSVSRDADFRQTLREEEMSLAILDVMLPDEDGFNLCRQIRSHQRLTYMPIVVLATNSNEADRVVGLELGADDYLGKPFSPRRLLVWVRTPLRRMQFIQVRGDDILAFEDWRLDTINHRLFHEDGEEFFLSGADFALPRLFLDHPQQILDRNTIANATHGRKVSPLKRIADVAVSRLRQRPRDTGRVPRLIQTVCGSDYLLTAQVQPHLQPWANGGIGHRCRTYYSGACYS